MLKHRKIFIGLVAILLLAGTVYFALFRYIPIKFAAEVATVPELPYLKNPKSSDNWFIVNTKEQYLNWISSGLSLPPCDLSKNFLIVSQYKITAAFYSPFVNDECCGVPRGIAYYDKDESKTGFTYIYMMPRIWLTQGVG